MNDELDTSLPDFFKKEFSTPPPNPGRRAKDTPEFAAWHKVKHVAMWEAPDHPTNAEADALRKALDDTPEAKWERYCFENSEKHLSDMEARRMEMMQAEALVASIREGDAERARRSYHNRKSNPGRDNGKSASPGLGK